MSKKNVILAICIIVFSLFLSACGESSNNAASSKSSAAQSFVSAQETMPETKASGQSSAATDSNKTNGQAAGSGESGSGSSQSQTSGESPYFAGGSTAPAQASKGAAAQQNEKSGTESKTEQSETPQNSKADTSQPETSAPREPEVRDNAEVNFNDL